MASQGPGRKRTPNRTGVTPEEDALNVIAREAEARLAAKRAARAEAREIRMKELERQQKEMSDDEESMLEGSRSNVQENSSSSVASFLRRAPSSSSGLSRDLDHVTIPDMPSGSSQASILSMATLTSSRKGSGGSSVTADTETSLQDIKEIHELKDQIHDVEAKYTQSLKEMKDSLAEMERKYRKAMVSNAQLDNEKSNLIYEVDTLKDSLMELEELLAETRRECEEKSKDLEREKHAHSILQFQFNEQKETLKQSEELLTALERQKEFSDAIRNERDELRDEVVQLKDSLKKHGIVFGLDLCTNGNVKENVTSESACSELQQGSSVLGTQELFRDENVWGSRGGQFQHPQDFANGIQENHLSTSASDDSSKSPLIAQNDNMEKTETMLNVFEVNAEENVFQISKDIVVDKDSVVALEPVTILMKGITDQQKLPLNVERSEMRKEENPDSPEKIERKILEKDHLEENVCGHSQTRMISDSVPSVQIETSHFQSSGASGKKKKKKKKNKQKQKHTCDPKEVPLEIGNNNEKQLIESSIQTAGSISECTYTQAMINEKVPDNLNIDQIHKGAECLEQQSPISENILVPITNLTGSTTPVDSKAELIIAMPTFDFPLESTTDEVNATNEEHKMTSNIDDAELKDIAAICADFPESEKLFETKPEKDKTEDNKDLVQRESVDEIGHLHEIHISAETSELETETQLDDVLNTTKLFETKPEKDKTEDNKDLVQRESVDEIGHLHEIHISAETSELETETQLDDVLNTTKVQNEVQEKDTQLDEMLITTEIQKEVQEKDTQLDEMLITTEIQKEVQEKDTQLDEMLITTEIQKEELKTHKPTFSDHELNVGKDGEVECGEFFACNVEDISSDGHKLGVGMEFQQKDRNIAVCVEQTCATNETRESDMDITMPQIATTEYDQFIKGSGEQGSQGSEVMMLFGHNENEPFPETKVLEQEASSFIPQEIVQNLGEQEFRDIKDKTSKRNEKYAESGSKKEGKKEKGKKIRLRKLVDEREILIEQVKTLKEQLEQKKKRHKRDESCSPEGDSNRQVSDFKFKLVKSEQEITTLEQNVTRLEGQVTRYRSAAENAEKVEDELKAEKRKLQRELRSALDKIEELESNNSHLNKRLEKMKTYRGMAASP
ncbi:dentin sialophosphoprotein isoform X17 [Silurus asotus]|uniref:Dentin sialophosphoprotein isoform X17 n=1 Tax=Silurus asotus TaxID=30991 RepID=A0AAD5FQ44_SILAS|nr:dentin sialophosphoprotein isoform X17 [Silurus asotus]